MFQSTLYSKTVVLLLFYSLLKWLENISKHSI